MKKYFLLFLPLFSCMSIPSIPQTGVEEPFVKVFDGLNSNKDQLYIKANSWMVSTFGNSESVIEFSDKESGVVIGKYLMKEIAYGGNVHDQVYAKIDVRVKDDKARISIEPMGTWSYDNVFYKYGKEDALADMEMLSLSFYAAMKKENIEF